MKSLHSFANWIAAVAMLSATLTPFTAAQGQIAFVETTHSFGTIDEGPEAVHVFTFRNEGDAPLKLTLVRASCGCTTPEWTSNPVPPGETGSIKVVYHSEGHPGAFTRNVDVWNDGAPGYTQLIIEGKVRAKPMENGTAVGRLTFNLISVDMGVMEPGLYAVQTFKVQNNSEMPVQITGLKLPAENVQAEYPNTPLGPGDLADVVVFVDTTPLKPGEGFNYTVQLLTDDVAAPEKSLKLQGSIASPK